MKLEAFLSQSQDRSSESFMGSLNQAEVLLHVCSNEQLQICSNFSIRNMLIHNRSRSQGEFATLILTELAELATKKDSKHSLVQHERGQVLCSYT